MSSNILFSVTSMKNTIIILSVKNNVYYVTYINISFYTDCCDRMAW